MGFLAKSDSETVVARRGGGGGDSDGVGAPPGSAAPPAAVVPRLYDEKPTHRSYCGDGTSGSDRVGVGHSSGFCGVEEMSVREWVAAFGECSGPMLAAWVFPAKKPTE